MADMFAIAGAKFYIGPSMANPGDDVTATTFSSITWTEVKDWTQCGVLGDAANLITTQVISRARDVKQKGTRNAGSMANVFAINASDPGQIAIIAAEGTPNNYPFKIEWDDAPGGVGSTPTINYFVGLVMSAQLQGGGPNTVRALNVTVEINSNVVNVPPTTGE